MVFLRKTLYIVLLLLLVMPVSAKKKPQPEVGTSVEQNQQFTYYWYAARQAIEEKRYADAYALLQFCHAIKPDDPQTLTFMGVLYQGIGDEKRANDAFKRAYELAPDDCWQRYLEPLKQQYIEQKEWKKALKTQDEIDKRQGKYDAYSALTRYRVYAMWGKPKKAVAAIDRYLEREPTDVRFLLFKLEIMERTHARPKELYALYDRILELDPYNLMILNNYAYHLATHGGDLTKAEKMSAITIREQPSNPTFLDTYGWILHLQGQNQLALFYLNKALWNIGNDDKMRDEVQKHIHSIK